MTRYPLFDWLRLVLALEVVAGHYFFASGFPAVASFLALSGFLVSGSINRNGTGWEFFKRRGLRVLPAFFVGLALTWMLFDSGEVRNTLLYYFSFGFARNDQGEALAVNKALWSLPFEEVAYILLAILAAKSWFRLTKWLTSFGAALCLCGFISSRNGDQEVYRALPLLWSLMVGVWASSNENWVLEHRNWGFPLLLLAGTVSFFGHESTPASLFAAPAVLFLGIGFRPKLGLGIDISYGIYIYHMPIFVAGLSAGWSRWACLGATIAMSVLSWVVVEGPMQRLKGARSGLPTKQEANGPLATETSRS